jgi:hypothetical protein
MRSVQLRPPIHKHVLSTYLATSSDLPSFLCQFKRESPYF